MRYIWKSPLPAPALLLDVLYTRVGINSLITFNFSSSFCACMVMTRRHVACHVSMHDAFTPSSMAQGVHCIAWHVHLLLGSLLAYLLNAFLLFRLLFLWCFVGYNCKLVLCGKWNELPHVSCRTRAAMGRFRAASPGRSQHGQRFGECET